MKHTLSFMVWAILAVLLPLQMAQAAAPPTELQKRLQNFPDISDIKPMQSDAYPEKYVFFINQLLDPHHPEAGNFKQRVILSHVGFDRPTVLVTEGYAAHYATHPRYQEELSKLFNANLVFVEYRYFGESMPKPCNWDYLTVENSLYDLHHVTTTLKQLYDEKWIATGISKGGQTTMFYRTYFPDDVDISVPYVAPSTNHWRTAVTNRSLPIKFRLPKTVNELKTFNWKYLNARAGCYRCSKNIARIKDIPSAFL